MAWLIPAIVWCLSPFCTENRLKLFYFPSGPNNDKLFWKNSDSIITCNLIKDINSYVILTFSIWSFWCAAIAPCKCHWLSLRMFTRLDTLTVYVLTIDGFYCYKLMTMISREITFWVFETKPCPEINLRFNEKGFLKILRFYSMKLRGLNKAFGKRWQLICFNLSCS